MFQGSAVFSLIINIFDVFVYVCCWKIIYFLKIIIISTIIFPNNNKFVVYVILYDETWFLNCMNVFICITHTSSAYCVGYLFFKYLIPYAGTYRCLSLTLLLDWINSYLYMYSIPTRWWCIDFFLAFTLPKWICIFHWKYW